MLLRKILDVCQNHTQHVKTLCRQNEEFLNVKEGDIRVTALEGWRWKERYRCLGSLITYETVAENQRKPLFVSVAIWVLNVPTGHHTALLLLLLHTWHYSLIRTVASLMDFFQSAVFLDLSFQFVILHLLIYVCAQFRHLFFGRPLSRCAWGLLLNTWRNFLLLSILLTWPIQFSRRFLKNESVSKSQKSYINYLLYRFLLFSFTLIPHHKALVQYNCGHHCYVFLKSPVRLSTGRQVTLGFVSGFLFSAGKCKNNT